MCDAHRIGSGRSLIKYDSDSLFLVRPRARSKATGGAKSLA